MAKLFRRPYQDFFDESIKQILTDKKKVLDIGGGLRISNDHANRIDTNQQWIADLVVKNTVTYTVLDYVDTYHPDIVGDIQDLPLPDNSQQSIVCLSILEHVENPFKATAEMYRVLETNGYCLVYVPFLFYYHAERGYYGDYWRFTEESLRVLFKPFASFEIHSARGPFESLIKLSPLGRAPIMCDLAFLVDKAAHKLNSKQTSGYYVFLRK